MTATEFRKSGRQEDTASAGWAFGCAVAGLIANVLLIMFFALSAPYGAGLPAVDWSGTANDVMVAVQFGTFVPVALGTAVRLPRSRAVVGTTVVGIAAMLMVTVLQLLLVLGALSFEVQIELVMPAMIVVFVWLITVNSVAHRHRSLPCVITRSGLLIGAAFLVGMVFYGAAQLMTEGTFGRLAILAPGIFFGALGWLALPAWPWLMSRRVFNSSGTVERRVS